MRAINYHTAIMADLYRASISCAACTLISLNCMVIVWLLYGYCMVRAANLP